MSFDIPGELEELKSRIRTLEGSYRRNDRQALLQRIGGGAVPRGLGLTEPRQPRGVGHQPGESFDISASDSLGNVQPWHGQVNVLIDPVFETLSGTVAFTGTAGTNGDWTAHYAVNSGSAPTTSELLVAYDRIAPDDNPFNSAVAELTLSWAAGASTDTDVYLYPQTDFSPNAIPTLPFLVAASRIYSNWSYLETVDSVSVSLQVIDPSGPTVLAESEARAYPSDEQQFQLVAPAEFDVGIADWRWRLKVHIEKTTTALDADLNIGIAEPQMHFAYTRDPVPFQPSIANWQQGLMPKGVALLDSAGLAITAPTEIQGEGLLNISRLRLSGDAAWPIVGLEPGRDGNLLVIHNTGTFDISLAHDSVSSTAGYRFFCPGDTDFTIDPDGSVAVVYDASEAHWMVIGVAGSGAGELSEPIHLTGIITPSSLTANQDDYNPTGFSTANVVRLSASTTTREIYGFAAQSDGRMILLINVGTILIQMQNEAGTSSAANRIKTPNTSTYLMSQNDSVFIWYDATSARWRLITESN